MKILMIGATSAIAAATARYYAMNNKADFVLVARNADALSDLQADLLARGAHSVATITQNLSEVDATSVWLESAFSKLLTVDLVLIAHGILGDQKQCEQDYKSMLDMMNINALSSMAMLTVIANAMEKQGKGTIAFISSVAGDRGRPSNYVYGASKAVVSTFLQGLRARMAKVGVHVLTIKPGFVDTPMTASIEKGGPLWAQPEDIAAGIAVAVVKKKNVVYLPWFWRIIMGIIIHIPEFIFKKLHL